jgi:ankyrin repeat protein
LHWACYSQSEIALSYLLAWNCNLNIQDKEGETALHQAVRSVEQMEACRPVRYLLLRGADQTIRNNKGQTP